MEKKTLKEKKEQLKKDWEECFEMKLDEVLTEKGIKHFWDDDTSYIKAIDLLTTAGVHLLVNACESEDTDEKIIMIISREQPKKKEKYEVERVCDSYFYKDTFDTEDDANEFIKNLCLTSEFKVSDFRVVPERK